jgi:hypothetical protein
MRSAASLLVFSLTLTCVALAPVVGCGKSSDSKQPPSEPGIPASPGPAGPVAAAAGAPAAAAPTSTTSTQAKPFVPPLTPTAQELEANRAAAEEYYRSPQGASGPSQAPGAR